MPEYMIAQIVVADDAESAVEKWRDRLVLSKPVSEVRALPLTGPAVTDFTPCPIPPSPEPEKFDFAAWTRRMDDRWGVAIGSTRNSALTGLGLCVRWHEALEIHMHRPGGHRVTKENATITAREWERSPVVWPDWLRSERESLGRMSTE